MLPKLPLASKLGPPLSHAAWTFHVIFGKHSDGGFLKRLKLEFHGIHKPTPGCTMKRKESTPMS